MLLGARIVMEEAHGGVADAAARHVDDPLEGEVVGRLRGGAQIGEGVADFLALVEARAADDAIVEAERDEALLEGAHLERGAHEDGDVVERVAACAAAARSPRRWRGLPPPSPRPRRGGPARASGSLAVGEQRLAEPAFIVGDEMRGGGEDRAGRAVVALEPDHLRAGEVVLEAEDVVDLGAAPAIDRLVVVADAADVLARLGEEAQPEILRDIGVLILVDQHVAELAVIVGEHVRLLAEEAQAFEQQVAEIDGVQHLQPRLIGGVEFGAAAIGESAAFARRQILRRPAAVLPVVDDAGERARRPALLVDILGLDDLLHQADLIVGVEDGEVRLQADQLGVAAQELDADRMERAEPLHALDGAADELADALLHLARGLVGEGDGEDFPRPRLAGGEQMGDARRQHARLAGAGAGEHQNRPFGGLHRLALFRVEAVEIGGAARTHRPGGDTADARLFFLEMSV